MHTAAPNGRGRDVVPGNPRQHGQRNNTIQGPVYVDQELCRAPSIVGEGGGEGGKVVMFNEHIFST